MDFDYDDEQQMLRDAVARFVSDAYGLEDRRKLIASEDGFSNAHWRRFAEFGWLMLNVPEENGGLGASMVETAIVAEQLGRGLALEPFVATAVLGARLLERSELPQALRDRWLGELGEGRSMLALAHIEPGLDYSLTHVDTRAERIADGYKLIGVKQVAVGAASAHRIVVSAQVDGEPDFSLFVVERGAEGVTLDPYALIDGTRAADVLFTGACVSAQARLAGPAKAREVLDEALDRARVAYIAQSIGSQAASLDLCSEYLKTRRQFGQPIGQFQALQHLIAEAFVDHQASRSMLYRALAHVDREPKLRREAVSAAKVLVATAGCKIAASGIQMHGGYGFTDEYAISHHYRHQLVLEKLFGNVEFHAQRLALAYAAAA